MRCTVKIIMSMAMLKVLTVLTFGTVSALAVDETKEANHEEPSVISINISIEQVERADIEGTAMSMEYTEFSSEVEWQFLLLDIDHRIYDWGDNGISGIVDPFEGLTRIAPGVQYYQKIGDKWGVWLKGVAIASFEDDLSSQSLTYNPQVVTLYSPTQHIRFYCGLGMLYHPVASTVYPVLGVIWNMESKQGFSGALGFPETKLRYGLNDKIALTFDLQWENRIYQLAEDNKLASEGYVKIEDMIPGLHVEYEPIDKLILSVGIRRYFDRQLTFFDHEENELIANEANDSWSSLLGLDYTF